MAVGPPVCRSWRISLVSSDRSVISSMDLTTPPGVSWALTEKAAMAAKARVVKRILKLEEKS
jgi:hypothetical protein